MGTYADYISLLCPTLSGIQKMLHICEEYAFNYKITLNATKSQLLYFSYLGKISLKFRAITNLSCVPLNPWLIPRINIQKSNLYRNGFIVKKLIYWSEHTHNRPGWRSKYSLYNCRTS